MKTSDAKQLIGKRVQWIRSGDPYRGTYCLGFGKVEEVAGKNILIDGEWKWLPDLKNLQCSNDSIK